MKKLLLILSILISSVSVFAQDFYGFDDLKYVGTDTINGYHVFILNDDDFTGTTKVSAIDTNLATELWVKDELGSFISPYGIISGGIVTWSSGLTFNVSLCKYKIAGTEYLSPGTQITLDSADATYDRIDVFAVNNYNQVEIIKGTPASNPQEPSINVENQIRLTSVLIQANATAPSPVVPGDTLLQYKVYDENIEWTASATGVTVDFNSTTDVKVGSISAEASATGIGDNLTFTTTEAVALSNINTLSMWLKMANTVGSGSLIAHFYHNTTWAGYVNIPFEGSSTDWQHIAVDLSAQTFNTDSVNQIQLLWNVSGLSGFFLDDVRLQGGLVSQVINDTEIYAGDVTVIDTGDYYAGDNVEDILKEIAIQFNICNCWNYGVQAITTTWNVDDGLHATTTLSGDVSIAFQNLEPGMTGNLTVTNAATVYNITFTGYTIEIAPYLTHTGDAIEMSGSSARDVLSWYYDGTRIIVNGTLGYE
nr:hypothetical protein [uncultured Draconibacterium sp.]